MKLFKKKLPGGGARSKAIALCMLSAVLAASLCFSPFAVAESVRSHVDDVDTPAAQLDSSANFEIADPDETLQDNLASTVPAQGVDDASDESAAEAIEGADNKPDQAGSGQTPNGSAEDGLVTDEQSTSDGSSHSATVYTDGKKQGWYTASVSDVTCRAGSRATISISLQPGNGTISEKDNSFSVSSITVPGVGEIQFRGSGLSEEVKKDAAGTVTFTADIPRYACGGTFPVTVTIENKKTGSVTLSAIVTINALYNGVACLSASDGGSQLSSYQTKYDQEFVAFAFDVNNYASAASRYNWNLKLESSTSATGDFVDVSDQINPQWVGTLPGAESQGVSGEATADSHYFGTSRVKILTDAIDADRNNVAYRATLQVTDRTTGETTEHSAVVYRRVNNLATHTFKLLNVGSKGSYAYSESVYDTYKGTDWFSYLYFDNAAKDPRVPFSDAESLTNYLAALPEALVDVEFNKYVYDLYNSNSSLNKKTDYADNLAQWYKDGNTPFHAQAKNKINNVTYSLADGGVLYDEDYFQNLTKNAQVSGREGSISISADALPQPREPRVYLIRTQGSWQMFDMKHALSDDGKGIMYSSIDELATYYDLKQALLRFSDFLNEKSGGSVALGFLTFSHAGEYTMFSGNGYLCNDPATIEAGIRGWDSFGDCEHSHYSDELLTKALNNVSTELANWKDSDGTNIFDQVSKTAIFIGGPCEPTQGTDGYAVSLPQDLLAANMNHTYGIQTVKGTSTVKDRQGNTIQSWLDYEGDGKTTTNNRDLWAKAGNGFYVAPSEDDIFNALVDIYNKDAAGAVTKYGTVTASVSDTVQKEFKVTGAKATWTSKVDGSVVNIPEDKIAIVRNDDGTTTVTCNYGECKGTGTINLDIAIAAQDDYIGGNNDLTNVDVPKLSFSGKNCETGETQQFEKQFTDKPSVNVSLLDLNVAGGKGTHQVGDKFNLADHATADLKDLLTGYPQTNGRLTLAWVEVDENGNELPNQTISFVPGSYRISDGELDGADAIALPDCEVNSDEVATRHFKLKATYVPDEPKNGLVGVDPAAAEAEVTLNWIDQKMVGVQINKVSAAEGNDPLPNVGFALYEDEGLTNLAGVYVDASLSQPQGSGGVLTDAEGHVAFYGLEIGKIYYLKEVKAAAGYSLSSQVWRVVAQSDSQVTVNEQVAPGSMQGSGQDAYYLAHMTVENQKVPSLPIAGALGEWFALIGGLLVAAGLVLGAWRIRSRRLRA